VPSHFRSHRLALLAALLALLVALAITSRLVLVAMAQAPTPVTGVFVAAPASSAANPIAAVRRTTWSTAGVLGGIPVRTTICSTLGTAGQLPTFVQSVTHTQINNALAACGVGQVVYLNAGRYNIAGGVDFGAGKDDVTLRGAGADQTYLAPSNDAGCHGALASICLQSADTNWKNGPTNLVSWTAGYTQGATTITLASVPNLKVGFPIILDQLDNTADDGGILVTDTTGAGTHSGLGVGGPYSLEGNGGGDQRSGRQQQQIVTVTGCGGVTTAGASCSGTSVATTISPGLYMPNWASGSTPEAWWASDPAQRDGVEDLTIDGSGNGTDDGNVELFNCQNCWVKGVRSINTGRAHVQLQYSARATVTHNYFFLTQNSVSRSYGLECYGSADTLVENNIAQAVAGSWMVNGNCSGTVFGYNFSINNYFTLSANYNNAGSHQHTAGIDYILFEGNYFNSVYGDVFHGSHHFVTYFRNRFTGPQPKCWQSGSSYATAVFGTCSNNTSPVVLQSFSRFENFVGNVLGTTGINTAYSNIWDVGAGNSNGTVTVPPDANVTSTLLRWGNCDSATGFSSCRFVASEVPSGLSGVQAPYANPLPGTQLLPSSMYLSARPTWYPAGYTWPPHGPDVTSGDISGTGGHSYTIPAQGCFLTTMGGPSDGTGPVLSFSRTACYPAS
jgi:hypothetical protein